MAKRLAAILCTVAMLLGCIASMVYAYAEGEQTSAPGAAPTSQESPAADGTVPEATADAALQAGGEETTPSSGEKTEEPTESTQLTEEVIEPAPETNQAPSVENTETVSEVPAQPTEAEQPPVTNQEPPAAPEEPKVEEPAPEQPKEEEPKSEEPKTEEPKSEEPKSPEPEAKSDEIVSPEQQINPNPDQQQDQKQPEAQPGTTSEGENPKDPASPEGTVPADGEQPEGNTPADGTNPEGTDPTTDGEDGDEDSYNEEGDAEDTVLPAELKLGESFSGTILAGEPFEITLKVEKAGTVILTLTAQGGDGIKAKADGEEVAFQDEEEADTLSAELTLESGADVAIVLSSDAETEFTLSASAVEEEEPSETEEQEKENETPEDEVQPEEETEGTEDEDTESPATESPEAESPDSETPDTESQEQPETPEEADQTEDAGYSVDFEIKYDSDGPVFGETAHFIAHLVGYDDVPYVITWQKSLDDQTWEDLDEHELQMDVEITPETYYLYWRVYVDVIEEPQQD